MSESLPLPPGWEAIYNEESKRCYFVDHVNKKTQWEDPRLNHPFIWGDKETKYLRQLLDAFNDVTESAAREALLTHNFNYEETKNYLKSKRLTSYLQPESRRNENSTNALCAEGTKPRRTSSSSSNRSKPSQQVDEFTFLSVKSVFSEVPDTIIRDVLKNCNNDNEQACVDLKAMGFDRQRQDAMNRLERIELDLEEKIRMKESKFNEALDQLTREFPAFSSAQVQNILEQTNCDLPDARSNLSALETKKRLDTMKKSSDQSERSANSQKKNDVPTAQQPKIQEPVNASTSAVVRSSSLQRESDNLAVTIKLPSADVKDLKAAEHRTLALGPNKANFRGSSTTNQSAKYRSVTDLPAKCIALGPSPHNLQVASFRKYLKT